MPYLLLIIGLLVAAFACFRFLQDARPAQIVSFSQSIFFILLLVCCALLAMTGRVGPAIAIMGALVPLALHFFYKKRKSGQAAKGNSSKDADINSEVEALEILEIEAGASVDDIKAAYKALMLKYHPDQGGNEYFARKLTAARDFLLEKYKENSPE